MIQSVQQWLGAGRSIRADEHDSANRPVVGGSSGASGMRFESLIDDLQVGVLIQGPDAEILLSNRAASTLLGLTEDQLLGRTSFDPSWNVIRDDGSPFPGAEHPVPRAIATRRPVRNVAMGVYRPRSGDRVWLLVDAEPRLDPRGQVDHVVCTFSDITERKRVEEALLASETRLTRESERLLALHHASTVLATETIDPDRGLDVVLESSVALLDAGSASLYRWDPDAELLRCVRNWQIPAVARTPDLRPGEGLAGQTFVRQESVIVNDYPNWEFATPDWRIGGLRAGLGVPLRHAGRPIGVLLIRAYDPNTPPFSDDDARLVALFADQAAAALESARLHADQRRRIERQRALARLNQLVSSSLDIDEVLREIARAAAALMDASIVSFWLLDEAKQFLAVRAFSNDGAAADFPRVGVRVGEGGNGWVAEHRQVLNVDDIFADGRFGAIDWWTRHGLRSYYGVPLILEDRLLGVIALNGHGPFRLEADDLDLLGSLVAQSALAIRNAQLYSSVAEANQALATAVAEAERANWAKSEFLSRVSHELRTPLNAILGFAQLLEMSDLSPVHGESVGHILKAGGHLLHLIDEVLDISQIEAGRLRLSPEPVELSALLNEVAELVAPLAAEAKVIVRVSAVESGGAGDPHPNPLPGGEGTRSSPCVVLADRRRLKQVLLNLLTNAVKYNREGGQAVVSCTSSGPDRIRIAVRDTGPGVDPAKLGRLFEPFDRLGAERSTVEGTGLGLTITRALVAAMDAELRVESVPGQGSQFWFELPSANPS